jgi:hypothetical protein
MTLGGNPLHWVLSKFATKYGKYAYKLNCSSKENTIVIELIFTELTLAQQLSVKNKIWLKSNWFFSCLMLGHGKMDGHGLHPR